MKKLTNRFPAAIFAALCCASVHAAVPPEAEVAKARALVQDIAAGDVQEFKAGKLSADEAVGRFREYAEQAGEDRASAWLFLKLAFDTALDGGVWEDASALHAELSAAFEPPKITKNSYRNLAKAAKKDDLARKLLARVDVVRLARKNLKDVQARLAKKPGDKSLTEALAVETWLLGDRKAAAALFEKAGGRASLAVAAEKTPEDAENRAQKAGEAAKIWWELSEAFGQKRPEAMELFKGHAGVLYAEALEGGIYEGLAKVVAEKRVEEAAEYGAEQAASVSAPRSAAEVRRRPGKLVEVKPNLKVADNPNVMHFKDRKGVTWAYSIQNGEALLRGVFANNNVAQGDLSGEVRVPVTLGNCPVLAIPNQAFNKCEAMTHIVLPPGLKSIGVHAFQHTKALEEIVVPESVEVIGGGAFSGSGIRKIQLPANIVRCCMGSTFCNCKRLEAIDLPDGIEHIGVFEFVGSTSLRKVHFPKSLKSMHDWTFHNCDLEEVVLPSGVERVGHHAFSDNRNLKFLKIESENIRIDGDGNYRVVFDLPAGVPVYVTKRWKGPLGSIHGHTVKCVK